MGNLFSFVDDAYAKCNPNDGPFEREARQFPKWSLERVKSLHMRSRKNQHGFGLVRLQFDALLAPDEVDYLPGIFTMLDTDNNGRIDVMEFISALAIISKGSFDETSRFVFELVDFNLNGSLSFFEMVLMTRACVHGILKMLGATDEDYPEDGKLEAKAMDAFRLAAGDDEVDEKGALKMFLAYEQFVAWLRSDRDIMRLIEQLHGSQVRMHATNGSDDSCGEASDDMDSDLDIERESLTVAEREECRTRRVGKNATTDHPDAMDDILEMASAMAASGGDESMASKPHSGAIKEPTLYTRNGQMGPLPPPAANLELEWVHGYRAFDCRNNLRYTSMGTIVYNTAALGVVYNPQTHRQAFYMGHTDDVISLALHPQGNVVATGQIGAKPSIHVWHAGTLDNLATLQGFHQRGVSQLVFSNNGNYLASLGIDNDHSIAVYDWRTGAVVASGKGGKRKLLSMAFSPNDKTLAVCGVKTIKFFDVSQRRLSEKKAILGKKGKIQSFLSIAYVNGLCVVGTAGGELYMFRNRQLSTVVLAHKQSVNALHSDGDRLISGSKDGTIQSWNSSLKSVGDVLDLTHDSVPSLLPRVVSVHFQTSEAGGQASKVLVGTRGGEILEMGMVLDPDTGAPNSTLVLSGHFAGELWGLSPHPSKSQYVTCGDDKIVRLWDLRRRVMLASFTLPAKGKAAAHSPDGKYVAITLDNGGVVVLDGSLLRVVRAFRHANQWSQVARFSPDGQSLAVGSHNGRIYLYSVAGGAFGRKAVCRGHSSYITHLDFSADSRYLQSNCGASELLFWDNGGNQIKSASAMRDVRWATWTCTLGWPVQGIWPPCADVTDINAVDRSKDQTTLVTADDFGKVKLFRYPCLSNDDASRTYRGHASHVTNVSFTFGGRYVISTGGGDKCVFQWRYDKEAEEHEDVAVLDEDEKLRLGTIEDTLLGPRPREGRQAWLQEASNANLGDDEMVELFAAVGGGDEFMAVKPWVGAIKAPSRVPKATSDGPDGDMTLDWVHGYRGGDCRNNLRYTANGEVLYHAAAVGVVHDCKHRTQRFHLGHTDDVMSLALHPAGKLVATGELGRTPKILVWDTEKMETVATLAKFHKRGVTLLAFNGPGDLLASVGQDNDHSLAIYDWKQERLVASTKTNKGAVLACAWTPGGNVVTCGKNHVIFWTVKGQALKSQKGIFGRSSQKKGSKTFPIQTALSIACLDGGAGVTVTGMVRGDLCVWAGNTLDKRASAYHTRAHQGPVFALAVSRDPMHVPPQTNSPDKGGSQGSQLVSGGKDGRCIVWSYAAGNLTALYAFSLQHVGTAQNGIRDDRVLALRSAAHGIRSLCTRDGKILIGTRGSEIYEMIGTNLKRVNIPFKADDPVFTEAEWQQSADKAVQNGLQKLVSGHWDGELWGLAVHPRNAVVATCGDDKTLRLWRLQRSGHAQVAIGTLQKKARALAFSPDGKHIAVGLFDGTVRAYRVEQARGRGNKWSMACDESVQLKGAREWISDIKFSPADASGTWPLPESVLAVGSHDNCIYLYSVSVPGDGPAAVFSRHKVLRGHSSYITHLDFSTDSRYLQSNCGAYELLFWNVQSGEQERSASSLRDVQWATWTCTLGWPVQGIWPAEADGTDVNAVDRSKDQTTLVTADDFGKVKLFRYPCVSTRAQAKPHRGHSSHVTNVTFAAGDKYVVTTGGNDKCVLVWVTEGVGNEMTQHSMENAGMGPESKDEGAEGAVGSDAGGDEEEEGGEEDGEEEEEEEDDEDNDIFAGLSKAGGDEFMAIKPWIGAIKEPSNYVPPPAGTKQQALPREDLRLQYVHGYASQTRGTVRYTAEGQVVYNAAALGVVCDASSHSQTFHFDHTDDVISLAVHPDGHTVATGELGKKPKIILWDVATCNTTRVIQGFHRRGVCLLAFAHRKDLLVSVGLDNDHSVAVYSGKGNLVASAKGHQSKILGIAFRPSDDALVHVGLKHVTFWELGRTLKSKKGIFGKKKGVKGTQPILSVAFIENEAVTGQADGTLYLWRGRNVVQSSASSRCHHVAAVNCLVALKSGAGTGMGAAAALVSGGKDGKVILWDQELTGLKVIKNLQEDPVASVFDWSVRSIDVRGGKVLLGTGASEIYEYDVMEDKLAKVMEGHFRGELWGLATHPGKGQFASAGDDETLRVWDVQSR